MNSVPGNILFNSLKDSETIVLACNPRIAKGVLRGVMRAAKVMDAAVIFELARSECDLEGGYTGLTPKELGSRVRAAAEDVQHDIWTIHADHIQVKRGTPEELEEVKQLIKSQIDSGYTSFAIDASYLFDAAGRNIAEELQENVRVTVELAKYIETEMKTGFGLEVEVGEIGRRDEQGLVLTQPDEAVCFITELRKAGIRPNLLAIANGSTHGNSYDADGYLVEQSSIDIGQTIAVGRALRTAGLDVAIAQHGITGTPMRIIKGQFPKKYIRKGNIATHYQNLVWEILEKQEPDTYQRIWDWTIQKYSKPGKKDAEIFGKNSKNAIKQFFSEIYRMKPATERLIEERSYQDTMVFLDAFNAAGNASIVRKALK